MDIIIAFLGNVGKQYAQTRHNLPWMLIDYLSFSQSLIWKKKYKGEFTQHSIYNKKIGLLKPYTLMNKSGLSIAACLHFFKIKPDSLFVVHDDTELNFGQIELKAGGGLAGHNGLRHLVKILGNPGFMRLRLGISKPSRGNLSSYVLGNFTEEESAFLPEYLESATVALEYVIKEGFTVASEIFHKKNLINDEE